MYVSIKWAAKVAQPAGERRAPGHVTPPGARPGAGEKGRMRVHRVCNHAHLLQRTCAGFVNKFRRTVQCTSVCGEREREQKTHTRAGGGGEVGVWFCAEEEKEQDEILRVEKLLSRS
ncbi:hypothetical protein PHYPO_G00185710 [Pangasianodon hypophthalmus]|uniref:Uncharacterized protein n=1 Tax=Pangasianodon hypophthalmus TaxID=310915 RepID=A0A5N5JPX6_PANHP|nr:hypothetical protein PHYPO_G00185710 [Pangasianodon hypophthalmus]